MFTFPSHEHLKIHHQPEEYKALKHIGYEVHITFYECTNCLLTQLETQWNVIQLYYFTNCGSQKKNIWMENYISVKSVLIIVLQGITKTLKLNAAAAQMLFLWSCFTCKGIIFLETEFEPTQRQSTATAGRHTDRMWIRTFGRSLGFLQQINMFRQNVWDNT